jgi:hypothetical protein
LNNKTRTRIISAVRKISRWSPARQSVKNACKIDKALFQCPKCGVLCYEGKSQVTFINYKELYAPAEVRQEYLDVDHISPAVPISGWDSWDNFMERLFCGEDNLQALCSGKCHKEKTSSERKQRLANKYGNKETKRKK